MGENNDEADFVRYLRKNGEMGASGRREALREMRTARCHAAHNGKGDGVTAEDILDIIEGKAKGAFVRELGIYDQEVVSAAKARQDALSASFKDPSVQIPDHLPDAWIRRIDGLDFSSVTRTAFEVKVTRSDWRRESPEKRRAWKAVTHRYIYVSPAGVIPVDEVPPDCGLWWVHLDPVPGTDRTVPRIETMRKATKSNEPSDLPWRVALNLCYREQRLRTQIRAMSKDYQSERKRGDRILADLVAICPGYTEWNR